MKPPVRVSAVVTSYNRPDFLRRVLLCFSLQTKLVNELVITDDGSSVDVPAGLADILPELPFKVIFVSQPHEVFRAAKSRNNGIRETTGKYLVFADQDIVFAPTYVERFISKARPREFLVGFPVRLDEAETAQITDEVIRAGRVTDLASPWWRREVRIRYWKETYYRGLHAVGLRPIGAKLRSCVFGAWRDDLLSVNGFDEEYRGWGNEDDDLGIRLHRAGIRGRNVFRDTVTVHMYHTPNHDQGARANAEYHARRAGEIRAGAVRASHGVLTPLGDVGATRRLLLHDPER